MKDLSKYTINENNSLIEALKNQNELASVLTIFMLNEQ